MSRDLLLGSAWPSRSVARAVGWPWAAYASRLACAVFTARVATARLTSAGLACARLARARLVRISFPAWAGLASVHLACGLAAREPVSCTIACLSRRGS